MGKFILSAKSKPILEFPQEGPNMETSMQGKGGFSRNIQLFFSSPSLPTVYISCFHASKHLVFSFYWILSCLHNFRNNQHQIILLQNHKFSCPSFPISAQICLKFSFVAVFHQPVPNPSICPLFRLPPSS